MSQHRPKSNRNIPTANIINKEGIREFIQILENIVTDCSDPKKQQAEMDASNRAIAKQAVPIFNLILFQVANELETVDTVSSQQFEQRIKQATNTMLGANEDEISQIVKAAINDNTVILKNQIRVMSTMPKYSVSSQRFRD